MVMRTTLMGNIGISANGSFTLYALDSRGRQTGTFYFNQTGKLARLNNFALSLDFSVSDLFKSSDEKKKKAAASTPPPAAGLAVRQTGQPDMGAQGQVSETTLFDEYGYMKFDAPWNLDISYSLNYTKPVSKAVVSQTLTARGRIQLTSKMDITYNTGYDFTAKEITMTQIQISRNLHCWNMSFNWVPVGYLKMWEFSIRANASILSDLKYERRKDYHDNF
jgi:hypothetical protein